VLNRLFRGRVKREREMQLAALKAQKDQLLQSCFRAMRRRCLAKPVTASTPSVPRTACPKLKTAGLKSFHQELAVPNNCVLRSTVTSK